ncbi:MAG: dual specificity protein phosphatase family protein, partial [bacterium]|nr:dual specificity protein phosphatase family protein [bacterium]
VDLTDPDLSRATQRAEQEASAELGISHHRFPLDGNGIGDIQRYADAIQVIADARENEEPVLVHCSAGARRVAGVVASYQLLVEGKDPEAAYAELDRYGRIPVAETPLVAFLNQNMGTLADELVSRGVLDRAPRPLPVFVPPD